MSARSYRFRQRSNMWYLTGFEEPDSAVVIGESGLKGFESAMSPERLPRLTFRAPPEKNSSSKGYKMTLFCKPKEPYDELWNGARTGLDGARSIFGADEVSLLLLR